MTLTIEEPCDAPAPQARDRPAASKQDEQPDDEDGIYSGGASGPTPKGISPVVGAAPPTAAS